MNVELTRKLVRRLRLCPLLWLQEKVVFNANITGNMQVIVAGFNEKRTQESSSGKTSADESDEEATHGLAECEIQESVEDDVQKSIYVGTSEAVVAGRSNHSKLNTCWYLYTSLTSVVIVGKDGLWNVSIAGIPLNDSREFET